MKVEIIQVPYFFQHESKGMGAGPERLVEAGAAQMLADKGHEVEVARIRLDTPAATPEDALVAVDWQLANEVRSALDVGALPVVMTGNCYAVLGVLAGAGTGGLGVIWFDAHGDYNTPETTITNYLDGMSLAIANGYGHEELRNKVGLEQPLAASRSYLFGVRDLDPEEEHFLKSTAVTYLSAAELRGAGIYRAIKPHLMKLRAEVSAIYLHLDLDVLDPETARTNQYNHVPGGLTIAEMEEALRLIAAHFQIRAATISAYNPEVDEDGRGVAAGLKLLDTLIDNIANPSSDDE